MNEVEKYSTFLNNIDFEQYYFGTNAFYDNQILESFPIRFPEGRFPWNENMAKPIYIMTCKTPKKKYILCCCELGGNIRGNQHTIWNLFKTLETENCKGICNLFITLLSYYYNNNFKQEGGDKLLNLYVIPKYSMAAYKSYIKNGFNINAEKCFWLNYRGSQEYALYLSK